MNWEQAVDWCLSRPELADLARDAYFGDPLEAAKRYQNSAEFTAILDMLPAQKGRALDLGAGNGILSHALAAHGWDVTAVEPDPSNTVGAGAIRDLAAKTVLRIEVIESFGEDIPLENAAFDLVVARQVLHHANDLNGFCREFTRLSRPGAKVITLRDHVISGPEQLQPFLDSHPLHALYGGENAFTLDEYRSALKDAGLRIDREMRSFQSVVNYDPLSRSDVRHRLAEYFGPLRRPVGWLLHMVPFGLITHSMSAVDRRPGRLVSFLCTVEEPT